MTPQTDKRYNEDGQCSRPLTYSISEPYLCPWLFSTDYSSESDLSDKSSLTETSFLMKMRRIVNRYSRASKQINHIKATVTKFISRHRTKDRAKDRDDGVEACKSKPSSQPNQMQISTFFRLPLELRDQIYQHVLGGQLIHIKYEEEHYIVRSGPKHICRRGRGLVHSVCSAKETENSIYIKFKAGQTERLECRPRHANCIESPQGCELNLQLLRVCKQVYEETRLIPYTANTFSVHQSVAFERFTQQLLPDQIQSIRALHLDVTLYRHKDALKWTRAFNGLTDASKELELRALHLCIKQCFTNKRNYRTFVDGYPEFWVAGFLRLRQCPLKDVTVVMTDDTVLGEGGHDWEDEYMQEMGLQMWPWKLTLVEKQGYCENVRKVLLNLTPRLPMATLDPFDQIRAEEEKYEDLYV